MEKIWLKHYPDHLRDTVNLDEHPSLVDLFTQCCEQFADKSAYSQMSTTLSFTDVYTKAQQFAAYLQHDVKLQKGDRIALMMPNVLQYPVALFGALLAGLVVVNVNPLYTSSELHRQLVDADVSCMVVLANFAATLEKTLPDLAIKHVIVTQLADLLPAPKRCIVNFMVKHVKRLVPAFTLPGAISFKHVLKQGKTLSFTPVDIDQNDLAFLQYTGGTTGGVKGAMLTHGNVLANISQIHLWVKNVLTEGREVMLTALPLYHIFSLSVNLFVALRVGANSVLVANPRDIASLIKCFKQWPFSVVTGVNTLYNALVRHPQLSQVNFQHLKLTIGGGMAVQKIVADKWQRITGKPIIEGYGLTEASPVVCVDPVDANTFNHSIGLPVPSTDIKIINDVGDEVALGEIGELCVKGPQVMRGYWKNDIETKKVLTQDAWLLTGDLVKMDEKGFVYFVDRKKDMIIVSGFNVYPNEIKEVIASIDGVLEVAVVGVPDDKSGERVKAVIVRDDNNLNEGAVIVHCKQVLTGYKVPKEIEFREALPKTPVGKIARAKV